MLSFACQEIFRYFPSLDDTNLICYRIARVEYMAQWLWALGQ